MAKDKSKKKSPIGIIIAILVAVFAVWMFIPGDEEADEPVTATTAVSNQKNDAPVTPQSTEAADSETKGNNKILSSKGAIRDKKVNVKGNGEDTVTIMIYMNGSNLETDDGAATVDLTEIIDAGSSDKVKILVQTMGTKNWDKKYGIASDHSQIYSVDGNGMKLLKDDLGQLDCTAPGTLSSFIKWSATNYPSDRYMLIFWDHGGGPVYGFGYDEWNSDDSACLSVDEMQAALKDAGVYFDFIGMDCCIMSCLETCCALYDYCDYAILSEDFESGLGWYYTNWLKELYKNTSISTLDLGKKISDEMVLANERETYGDSSIMAVIDESMMKVLYTAWVNFAYANEDSLLGTNYSEKVKRKSGGRILPSMNKDINRDIFDLWNDFYEDETTMADYFITDIMAVAQNIDSEESAALASAVKQALVYVKATEDDSSLTGISVTLPYGDRDFYSGARQVFTNIGLDSEYVDWLGNFADVSNDLDDYDYTDWNDYWGGWDDYEDDYDWDEWDYDDWDDEFWNDGCSWDDWDYDDSFNCWSDVNGWLDWLFGDDEEDWDDEWDDDFYYYDDFHHDNGYYHYYDDWDDDDWSDWWDEDDWDDEWDDDEWSDWWGDDWDDDDDWSDWWGNDWSDWFDSDDDW